ncbi:hypothetical protein DSO57_1009410 [Entomophthora muscae]|uniref:Uncharacterized protein n=1 Tax=Entomophthora muscae TaxID=34485 RepID=A0ACC2U4L6_9FUNG|nr:hypothetical protein DSO57_1009410 [Entomophthora muscae]
MKEIPANSPLPDALPAQDFKKLGFVYTIVLGIANQLVPYTGSWCPWTTAKDSKNTFVRINNSLPLETQAQGQDLNSEPKFLQAAGPMDQQPTHLRFAEIKPPQAEAPAKS